MKTFSITCESAEEKAAIVRLLCKTLDRKGLQKTVLVVTSARKENIVLLIADDTLTPEQERIVIAMKNKVKNHITPNPTPKVVVRNGSENGQWKILYSRKEQEEQRDDEETPHYETNPSLLSLLKLCR